jgi:glycosyltransferase involved in cell wall biosynthesis
MRILYFHQHFTTPMGAAGTRSYEMARELIRQGHEVIMVAGRYEHGETGLVQPFSKGQRRGMVDGIDVVEFDLSYSNHHGLLARSLLFAKYAFAASMLALREHCDLVFATSTPLTAAIPGIVARLMRGKPFVFEVRDLWPELPRAMGAITNPIVLALMGLLEWLAYRTANRLVALAPGIAEGIAKRHVARSKIAMVPNGCDLDLFDPVKAQKWRPQGVVPDDFLAVFSGTHGPANGLSAIIDAAAELQRRGECKIKFCLVGDGNQKAALQKEAMGGALENVVFLEPVNKRKLAGLFAASDMGLQILANVPAFYYGTSPNKFFDYLAAGLPVLTNYPGWIAGMIRGNSCGHAVPPDDPSAFADALQEAACNREALRRMGANALALAQSRFERRKLAEQWAAWVTGISKT